MQGVLHPSQSFLPVRVLTCWRWAVLNTRRTPLTPLQSRQYHRQQYLAVRDLQATLHWPPGARHHNTNSILTLSHQGPHLHKTRPQPGVGSPSTAWYKAAPNQWQNTSPQTDQAFAGLLYLHDKKGCGAWHHYMHMDHAHCNHDASAHEAQDKWQTPSCNTSIHISKQDSRQLHTSSIHTAGQHKHYPCCWPSTTCSAYCRASCVSTSADVHRQTCANMLSVLQTNGQSSARGALHQHSMTSL
jgi:hypothetical protein